MKMQKRINTAKKEYFQAKERIDALRKCEAELERLYIQAHGITNPDGSIPQCIEDIVDDDTFNAVNKAFPEEMEEFYKEYGDAEKALINAERELAQYALDLAPESVRFELKESAKRNAATVEKLAELVLRLDVSTIAC